MKVALVHDWLTGLRGGERCLQAFLKIYPEADIFTLLHVPGATAPEIDARVRQVSFFRFLPGAKRYYRLLLPFYPLAVRSLKIKNYDLVISLSHAAAKNVSLDERAIHICYCFTPMRYIWDQAYHYFGKATGLLWPVLKALRIWDRRGSRGVHHFVAISHFVASRIRCFYKRRATVIYPPVETDWIRPVQQGIRGEAFLYAGALVPYKKPDLVVKAFNELGEKLWIVGSGPEKARLQKLAGPNIEFVSGVSDLELADYYRRCRALVFPGKEDFGMIPIEALAAGRPVIGLFAGALRESLTAIKPWRKPAVASACSTGVFIENRPGLELEALIEAVRQFIAEERFFTVESCCAQARNFSAERFYRDWRALLLRLGLNNGNLSQQEESYAQAKTSAF